MKIYIKNMVCNRCVIVIDRIFKDSGYLPESLTLGEVVNHQDIEPEALKIIGKKLKKLALPHLKLSRKDMSKVKSA
jgi:AraC family transcriptional regulator